MPELKTKSIAAAPGQTKVWKARLVEAGPEVTLIRVPISSTTEDRDGDEFSPAGLASLAAGLNAGKTPLYLDHGYQATGARLYGALNMLGAWIDGEIEGSTLYGTAFVEPENWFAEDLTRKIAAGLPIGFSVGFGVVKARDKPNGGLIFDEVSLWEVSAVGIPSNPDAVNSAAVQAVVKSLRIKAGLEQETMKRKTKEGEEPDEEEEQEEKQQPCTDEEEEQKAPEGEEPDEEEEEEEKTVEVLDETMLRSLIAEEVAKALSVQMAPIHEHLKTLAAATEEIKAIAAKTSAPKAKGPRAIVVARATEPQPNTPTPDRAYITP